MIIVQGEVHLEKWYINILESEIVRRQYQAVVKALVSDLMKITRYEDAAKLVSIRRRQL